ncbi:MAG: alpha/beta fold hydrolase, partial [Thermoproteus sp.]|nr:alpha/beta fold hydrolase [Thermoproteus sp.]
MEEGTITVEGTRIRYIAEGSGKALVLLHGYSFNSDDWFNSGIAQALARSYAVYAIDMPYGAKSKSDRMRADARGYARFLGKLLDALALGEPAMVGPSMSGQVLLRYLTLGHLAAAVVVGPVGLGEFEAAEAGRVKTPLL